MAKCNHNPGMECFGFKCPFDDDHFLEQLEIFLRDFPIRVNEIRMLHRCDMALSLVGCEKLAAAYLYSGKVTRRRCEGMGVVYERWERRKRANAIEIAVMLGNMPQKSSEIHAR